MTINEIVDKFKKAYEQCCKAIKALAKSLNDFSKDASKNSKIKKQGTSPKQYGMSLMKKRCGRSNEYNFYKTEQKAQKHFPYQRRNYYRS